MSLFLTVVACWIRAAAMRWRKLNLTVKSINQSINRELLHKLLDQSINQPIEWSQSCNLTYLTVKPIPGRFPPTPAHPSGQANWGMSRRAPYSLGGWSSRRGNCESPPRCCPGSWRRWWGNVRTRIASCTDNPIPTDKKTHSSVQNKVIHNRTRRNVPASLPWSCSQCACRRSAPRPAASSRRTTSPHGPAASRLYGGPLGRGEIRVSVCRACPWRWQRVWTRRPPLKCGKHNTHTSRPAQYSRQGKFHPEKPTSFRNNDILISLDDLHDGKRSRKTRKKNRKSWRNPLVENRKGFYCRSARCVRIHVGLQPTGPLWLGHYGVMAWWSNRLEQGKLLLVTVVFTYGMVLNHLACSLMILARVLCLQNHWHKLEENQPINQSIQPRQH